MAGLGAASRLFRPIERSLRSQRPEMAVLSPAEAHHFLREIGPLLESNGFGVLLPDWWISRQRTRLGLRLRLFADEGAVWNSKMTRAAPYCRTTGAAPRPYATPGS